MLTHDDAARIARAWIEAWNAHDLEAIMAHYAPDVEFGSPFVATRGLSPDGILHGTDALRAYFAAALAARPDLAFELDRVYAGPDTVAVAYHWRSGGVRAVEVMRVRAGLVAWVRAHYVAEEAGVR